MEFLTHIENVEVKATISMSRSVPIILMFYHLIKLGIKKTVKIRHGILIHALRQIKVHAGDESECFN